MPSPSGTFQQPDVWHWLTQVSAAGSLTLHPAAASHARGVGPRLLGRAHAGQISVLRLQMLGSGRLQLQSGSDALLLLFSEKGALSGSCGLRALQARSRDLLGCLLPHERLDLANLTPASSLLWLQLPYGELCERMRDFDKPPLSAALLAEMASSLRLALLPMLEAFLQRTGTALDSREQTALRELESTVLFSFIRLMPGRDEALAAQESPTREASERSVLEQAEQFMRLNLHRDLELADLTAACDCSKRSLQMHFRQIHGITPMQRLRQLRLEVMHQQLLLGATVAEACRSAGMPATGRTAALYRQAFGTTPSQTLAGSRPSVDVAR